MNDETICNPVPGAEVDGFNFFRDRNGSVIARCCWCLIGFHAAAENGPINDDHPSGTRPRVAREALRGVVAVEEFYRMGGAG